MNAMHHDDLGPHPAPQGSTDSSMQESEARHLARRRALLKGLGKGSAAVAVVVPIQTMASPQLSPMVTNDNTLCTISGQFSSVLSRTLTGAVTCTGYKPSHYWEYGANMQPRRKNWPTLPTGVNKFNEIFGGSDARKLVVVLQEGLDAAYWVAAYFNALDSSLPFPYGAQDVIDQYKGVGTGSYLPADFLAFYKKHLSSLN